MVKLHVEVDPRAIFEEGHRMGHPVKAALLASSEQHQGGLSGGAHHYLDDRNFFPK